jgi:hypothetical protein
MRASLLANAIANTLRRGRFLAASIVPVLAAAIRLVPSLRCAA